MDDRIFCYRLDIDNLYDLEVGVPAMLDLARELEVKFSFFVTLGKAFSYYDTGLRYAREFLARGSKRKKKPSLREKVGSRGILKQLITNPDIGLSRPDILRRIVDEGHDLGLHGGMNHALWQVRLESAPWREIRSSFEDAYGRFEGLFGKPSGFTAPGFACNDRVLELLDEFGFAYGGELEGEAPFHPSVSGRELRHLQIPVTVKAPGNVGYKEWLHARGLRGDAMLQELTQAIGVRPFAHIYSHPGFASSALPVVRGMLTRAKADGYVVLTMREVAARWDRAAPSAGRGA